MAGVFGWECQICKQESFFRRNEKEIIPVIISCDEKKHREFEKKCIDPSNVKCSICNKVTVMDNRHECHDGCTIFKSTKEFGKLAASDREVLGFHVICGTKLKDLIPNINDDMI